MHRFHCGRGDSYIISIGYTGNGYRRRQIDIQIIGCILVNRGIRGNGGGCSRCRCILRLQFRHCTNADRRFAVT